MPKRHIQAILIFLILSPLWACRTDVGKERMKGFSVHQLSEEVIAEMYEKNVFSEDSPIPLERLRVVQVRYYDFQDSVRNGELIVLDAVSDHVRQIFQELYARQFRLAKVRLITAYDGSDSLSMVDNNTSAHNLRPITGGKRFSLHAYGAAIDVNPVQNPFIDIPCDDTLGVAKYQPTAGIRYANRMENRPGRDNRKGMAERVVDVFSAHGFYGWGGYWNCPIDYQHFQVHRAIAEILVAMPPERAGKFFETVVGYFNENKLYIEDALASRIKDESLARFYMDHPEEFLEIVDSLD